MNEFAIEARGLEKIYRGTRGGGDKHALKGIDLCVPRGSIFGLLGPNGAGKSTFINILAGMTVKSAGQVSIWGFDIDQRPRNAAMSIGIVPQELTQDPFFTARETLEIQAGLYGIAGPDRKTAEILSAVGLTDKADAYARTLSGGMRRRLLVGKAMVHSPPVLVLDEPTAGVDIELRQQLWDHVVKLNKAGITIVLTTHYLAEAQELCDRIAIINHGEVVADEPKADMLSRLDAKRLIVHGETPPQSVPAGLEPYEPALRDDGALILIYKPSATGFDKVLEDVRATGLKIRDLSTEEADLEDVFLALTAGAHSAA